MKDRKYTGLSFLALFFSLGTLLCCVFPLVLVTLGLGAAVAAMISQFPILVTLSQHKIWIFIFSALLLVITARLLWRSGQSCPADPRLAAVCKQLNRWNKRIFYIALSVWSLGFVVTYVILPLWIWWEGM